MSRVDLNQIQAQLKVAIQSHQILVAKMKNDPQNGNLQKQLHELQSEITSLSERQKSIVQLLRKELVSKQPQQVTVISQGLTVTPVRVLPPPQTVPTNLSTKGTHATYITSANNTLTIHTTPPGGGGNVHHQPVIITNTRPYHNSQPPVAKPVTTSTPQPVVTTVASSRTASPPIRVPQYPLHRPSILTVKTQLQNGTANSNHSKPDESPKVGRRPQILRPQGAPNIPTALIRKNSDSDTLDAKRASIERKQLTPEERQKLEYMASLDLVTPETLKELQSKRSERKRRSTANPQFSYGHFEPERKRNTYLANPHNVSGQLPGGAVRKRGRPPKRSNSRPATPVSSPVKRPNTSRPVSPAVATEAAVTGSQQLESPSGGLRGDIHEDYCAICHRSGELLMCDTCSLVYHLGCLDPPLTTIPQGMWSCPKCVVMSKSTNNFPGTLQLVHSYIAHKTVKEEEKKKLEKKGSDLQGEKLHLEEKAKQLKENMTNLMGVNSTLMFDSNNAQQSVDKLKTFIKFFQSP